MFVSFTSTLRSHPLPAHTPFSPFPAPENSACTRLLHSPIQEGLTFLAEKDDIREKPRIL